MPGTGYFTRAAAQDALVADAAGDAAGVHRLEQALCVLARHAQPVAQLGEGDAAVRLRELHRRGAGFGERLGGEREVASGPHRPTLLDERGDRRPVAGLERGRLERGLRQAGVEPLDGVVIHRRPPLGRRRLGRRLGNGARPPRRRRVGHGRAGDRHLRAGGAHDQPVAGGRRHPAAQPQLHVAGVSGPHLGAVAHDDGGRRLGRPVVDGHDVAAAHAAGRRGEHVETPVQPVRARQGAGRRGGVAAAHLGALHADERERDPLPGRGGVDLPVVHLHAADAHLAAARLDGEPVAGRHGPRPERAGDDRADAAEGEHAVDRQTHRPLRGPAGGASRQPVERAAQVVQAGPRAGRHLDDGRARVGAGLEQLLDAQPRQLGQLVVDEVTLRERNHSRPHAEQLEHGQVLARLRHHAVVRRDHEHEHVDAGRAGDHRAHEPLVPGHVDDGDPAPRRQLERCIAELDRDPARLLLREPVGVDARQGGDERGLAVVDVAGGAESQRLICRH